MNMYIHELKMYRKSTIIWACSLIGIIVLFMSMFSSFSQDAALMQKIFENFPEEVQKAFGFSSLDLSTLLGYYGFIFAYVLLCGAIQAMILGTSIVSMEVREKTADFLLAKPVTRQQIITSKLLAALTCVVITNLIYFAASIITMEIVKSEPYSMKLLFMINITMFFVQLIFISLGILISVIAKKINSVLSVSLAVVFGFYIINLFGSAIGDEAIRYITPFRYFDIMYILENGAYEAKFIIIGIVFVVAAIIASYLVYSKKDINAF